MLAQAEERVRRETIAAEIEMCKNFERGRSKKSLFLCFRICEVGYGDSSGLWLKIQASCGQKDPRKLDRKAAVSMATTDRKSVV